MNDPTDDLLTSLFAALQADADLSEALGGPKIFDRLPEQVA